MQLTFKSFPICVFLILFIGLAATAARVEAYTPFYELSAPTRMGSTSKLLGGHVDAATGAYCYRKHLLTVTGYPTISADIFFNSQDSGSGPFGKGTSTPYDWFVTHSTTWPGSPWVLIGPGNRHFIFDTGGAGVYTDGRDPQMLGASLSFNSPPAGELCVLTFKTHDRWEFDPWGGLIAMHTRCTASGSNTTLISRNTSGFTVDVQQSISSVWRGIEYSYTGSPAVCTMVTAYDNWTSTNPGTVRAWTFTYTNSSTTLSTLVDVQGRTSRINWTSYVRSDGAILPLVQNRGDNRGNTVESLTYDGYGRVVSAAMPVAGAMAFGWNDVIGASSYVTVTLPGGHSYNVSWLWNTAHHGYWINVVHDLTLGEYTTFEQNASPTYLRTAVVDYLGHRSTLTWDTAEGNLLSSTYPTAAGGTATYSYQYDSVFHHLNKTTDPLGNVSTQVVDAATGDVTSRTDAAGNVASFLYAGPGYCYRVTDALGHATSFTYDLLTAGMTSTTDSLGHMTTYALDAAGNSVTVTLPNNRVVNYGYNSDDSLASINRTMSDGTPINQSFTRDANDNVTAFTDANGNVWSSGFDAADRMVSYTNPLGAAQTWSYNPDNTINTYTDAMGHVCVTAYDLASRPTTETFRVSAGGTVESTVSSTYDATTHLVSSVNDSSLGTTTLARDGVLEVTSTVQPYGTITRTYDILGRTASETLSGQPAVTYHYNALGAMDSETQNGLTTNFVYDNLGRLVQQQFPNGVTVTDALDATGAVLRATSTKGASTLDDTAYTRDVMGNIATSQANGGPVSTYSYDSLNRLAGITNPTHIYAYDKVGNPTVIAITGGTNSNYYYNAANTLTSISGNAVTANTAGMTTGYNGGTYTWDIRGRLTGYAVPGVSATFKYFPAGFPAQQVVNGTATNIVMSGSDILAEITGGVATTTLNSPSFGQPVSRGGLYHSTNGVGSTTLLTNSSGSVVQTYTYTPLGITTKTTGTDSPYQFRGSYNGGFGLDRAGTTLYDPTNPPLLHAQANGPQNPLSAADAFQLRLNYLRVREAAGIPFEGSDVLRMNPYTGELEPIAVTVRGPNGDLHHYGDVGNAAQAGTGGNYASAMRKFGGPGTDFGGSIIRPLSSADLASIGGNSSPTFTTDPVPAATPPDIEPVGDGGGFAGGAGGLLTLVTPNPFSPTNSTPFDDLILTPIWNHFHPPYYDAALEADAIATARGVFVPGHPLAGQPLPLGFTGGPGSPAF